MSEISEVVISVQHKVSKLVKKMQALHEINESLLTEIEEAEDIIIRQGRVIESLEKENETLRLANSLLGSDEYKKETKLKINSIIREIDYCINQLSE